jgi:hypothetical protein
VNQKEQLHLAVQWDFEDYLYTNYFNLEQEGLGKYIISKNGVELPKPKTLYKFFNNSEYSLDSLQNGYFYFSHPKHFNDPFECLNNREEFIIKNASNKENAINHRDNIGVCCFTTNNENPLMWGHYTNNYRGFCLKFKNENLVPNNIFLLKNHVSYLKNYQPGNDNLQFAIKSMNNHDSLSHDFKENVAINLKILFEYGWKYFDWNYEKEYRFITVNGNKFDRKLYYDKNCLEEIYIGYRMKVENENIYNQLISILKTKYPAIKIYEIKPNPLIVKLDFILVNT